MYLFLSFRSYAQTAAVRTNGVAHHLPTQSALKQAATLH